MSGRRIDDHSSWVGKGSKGVPLPLGSKMKEMSSAEGAGHVGMEYPDTDEKVKGIQKQMDGKIKAKPMKPGYRY